jgi:DNA-binding transcriptional MerR regulator
MKFVREPEMAKALSVSQRTLREWRSIRLIPFLKINRVVMYDPERVRAAIQRFERREVAA